MTALAVGLLFGIGVLLLYWSMWPMPSRIATSARRAGPRQRMRDELIQAGFDTVSVGQLMALSAALFLIVVLAAASTTRVLPVAICFALGAAATPKALVAMRARKRRVQLRDLWPDAVDNVASAVRAGLALPEALSQLAVRGPEELRPAFAAFAEDYRASGRFHECLDRLKARLSDPIADRLIESLRIAREVGGSDLGTVLRTLSRFLREDARTRAELETRQGWTVNAARLAAAAPWVVLAMLSFQPKALTAYSTPQGVAILAVGAGVTVLAYRLMVRIGRLPDDERVLR